MQNASTVTALRCDTMLIIYRHACMLLVLVSDKANSIIRTHSILVDGFIYLCGISCCNSLDFITPDSIHLIGHGLNSLTVCVDFTYCLYICNSYFSYI